MLVLLAFAKIAWLSALLITLKHWSPAEESVVCLSDIPQEHRFEYNSKWYAKLKVSKMRQTNEYGKTHSVAVNTYKPPVKEEPPVKKEITEVDPNLPF